jgi:hypothetical protein
MNSVEREMGKVEIWGIGKEGGKTVEIGERESEESEIHGIGFDPILQKC